MYIFFLTKIEKNYLIILLSSKQIKRKRYNYQMTKSKPSKMKISKKSSEAKKSSKKVKKVSKDAKKSKKTKVVKKQATTRFRTAQYENAGFHFPAARITRAVKEAVFRDLEAPIKEIKAAKKSNKKISDLSANTRDWIDKAEFNYQKYLEVRKSKGFQQYKKELAKWEKLDLPEEEEDKNEKVRKYKMGSNDKKLFHPGEFVLDKYADTDPYDRAVGVINRNKLKYSSTIGAQLAILLDDLVRQWIVEAVNNCDPKRVTIKIQDFIYSEDGDERTYLEDTMCSSEEKINSLVPLAFGFKTYHKAKNGEYTTERASPSKKKISPKKGKNTKKAKKGKKKTKKSDSKSPVRSSKSYEHYSENICQSIRYKRSNDDDKSTKFSKAVRSFLSDIVVEFINKMGAIIGSRMYFFKYKPNKAKTVSVEIMYELINTLLLYHNIDHKIYNSNIKEKVEKFNEFCSKRREKRAADRDKNQKASKEKNLDNEIETKEVEDDDEEEVVEEDDEEVEEESDDEVEEAEEEEDDEAEEEEEEEEDDEEEEESDDEEVEEEEDSEYESDNP